MGQRYRRPPTPPLGRGPLCGSSRLGTLAQMSRCVREGRRLRRAVGTLAVAAALVALTACVDEPTREAGSSEVSVAGEQLTRVDPATDGRFVVGVLLAQSGPLAAA